MENTQKTKEVSVTDTPLVTIINTSVNGAYIIIVLLTGLYVYEHLFKVAV